MALIALNRPAANALTPDMRRSLDAALTAAIQSTEISAIVLHGSGSGFCAGVDLSEFDSGIVSPWVSDLCLLIEESPKPVVCALHGMVLGAGFELALAAHARVAHQDTRLGMPEAALGIIPGAGGTQRLPRLIGAQRSLELLLSGQIVLAGHTHLKRVITQLTPESPLDAAVALARDLAERGEWQKSCDADAGFSDPTGFQTSIAGVAEQLRNPEGAEADIIRCVEAAQLLPFSQGLAFEETLFQERLRAPSARGPRHALTAERYAAMPPAHIQALPLRHVVVSGGDALARELAVACLNAGLLVTVLTLDDTQLRDQITRLLQQTHAAANQTEEQLQERLGRLRIVPGLNEATEVDLVLDGGVGPMVNNAAIWAGIKPAIQASRATAQAGQGRHVALHFRRPVQAGHVVEMAAPDKTDPQAIATILGFCSKLRCSLIPTRMPAGTLSARLNAALDLAACQLVAHGASPYAVDKAAIQLGFANGPFQRMDHDGLGHVVKRLTQHAKNQEFPDTDHALLQALADQGRTGRAAGRGVYIYGPDGAAVDPTINERVRTLAIGSGAAEFDQSRLTIALLGALINESAALLAERVVGRALYIDLMFVRGLGYAKARGGPLLQADMRGIFSLYKDMQQLESLSSLWAPHPGISTLVKSGQGFFGRGTV